MLQVLVTSNYCFREVLEFASLEERLLSVVIKHLSLSDTVSHLGKPTAPGREEETALLNLVVDEVFRRLDALVRQLQVCCLFYF